MIVCIYDMEQTTYDGRVISLNNHIFGIYVCCLLYTSDAADERSSVDLGGRRIIKTKKEKKKSSWL